MNVESKHHQAPKAHDSQEQTSLCPPARVSQEIDDIGGSPREEGVQTSSKADKARKTERKLPVTQEKDDLLEEKNYEPHPRTPYGVPEKKKPKKKKAAKTSSKRSKKAAAREPSSTPKRETGEETPTNDMKFKESGLPTSPFDGSPMLEVANQNQKHGDEDFAKEIDRPPIPRISHQTKKQGNKGKEDAHTFAEEMLPTLSTSHSEKRPLMLWKTTAKKEFAAEMFPESELETTRLSHNNEEHRRKFHNRETKDFAQGILPTAVLDTILPCNSRKYHPHNASEKKEAISPTLEMQRSRRGIEPSRVVADEHNDKGLCLDDGSANQYDSYNIAGSRNQRRRQFNQSSALPHNLLPHGAFAVAGIEGGRHPQTSTPSEETDELRVHAHLVEPDSGEAVSAVPVNVIRRRLVVLGFVSLVIVIGVVIAVVSASSSSGELLPTASPTTSQIPSASPTIAPIAWTELALLSVPDTSSLSFGISIAISDDASVILIGSRGAVYLYRQELNDLNWSLDPNRDIIPKPSSAGSDYGIAVAMSSDGNIVAVANPSSIGGRLQLSYFTGMRWTILGQSLSPLQYGPTYIDEYIRGEFLAVARQTADVVAIGTAGASHVETLNLAANHTWVPLPILQGDPFDDYGFALDLSADGRILAIGARTAGATAEGFVEVYEWVPSQIAWVQRGQKIRGESNSRFGYAVQLSDNGDVLAASANFDFGAGELAGKAQVFEWNGQDWVQRGQDLVGNPDEFGIEYGRVLAMTGDGSTLAVGSQFRDPGGSVYMYRWTGQEWVQRGNRIDGTALYGNFGSAISVSADGDIVVVGSYSAGNGEVRIFGAVREE